PLPRCCPGPDGQDPLTRRIRTGGVPMTSALMLGPAQRSALLRAYRRDPDPAVRLRAHIILMLADELPWATICAVLFCSSRTVARWKQRFEDGGVEGLLGRPCGAPPRWSEEVEAILRQALEHSPDQWGYRAVNWTVLLLQDHIEQRWGQRPSDRRVRQHLHQLGYVWKRPRHAVPESRSPRGVGGR